MKYNKNTFGLTLSGGGIKGFSYIGVFKASEEHSIRWANMAGVSVGALAIALKAANYNSSQLLTIVNSLDFNDLRINELAKLPIIKRYKDLIAEENKAEEIPVFRLFNQAHEGVRHSTGILNIQNILKNIITYSNEKALLDGDYLEEWIYGVLAKKGIRTFSDLRNGLVDKNNPSGYKIRMTCVDCTRVKILVLPDDLKYYGINPDEFEVAKAVRISSCIPFAFKPIVIEKNGVKHYLIDGGVFDTFPFWLVDNSVLPTIGFRIKASVKNPIIKTPINILRNIISSVYDIGIPYHSESDIDYIEDIRVADIPSLDFNISDNTKKELIESGYESANKLYNRIPSYSLARFIRNVFK